MKKIYVNPETKVIKVYTQQMIATSMSIEGETDIVESRGGGNGFWGEDEDDDY